MRNKPHILLIDDNISRSKMIVAMLQKLGCNVDVEKEFTSFDGDLVLHASNPAADEFFDPQGESWESSVPILFFCTEMDYEDDSPRCDIHQIAFSRLKDWICNWLCGQGADYVDDSFLRYRGANEL